MLKNLDIPDLLEMLRNLSDEALINLAFWVMTTASTPADLEHIYEGIMLKLVSIGAPREWTERCTRVYLKMWYHFTGGHL